MKVVIFAAGMGTRLRPLTDSIPKPMVKVGGVPILERIVSSLADHGLKDIILNTHYLPEVIRDHFGDGSRFGVRVDYFHENDLVGSAGAIKRLEEKLPDTFMVLYGDNVYDVNFRRFADLNPSEDKPIHISVFDRYVNAYSGAAGGVLEVDDEGLVRGFYEGVGRPELGLVNVGLYVLHPKVMTMIPEGEVSDFGRHFFPRILGEVPIQTHLIEPDEAVFGVDSFEFLENTEKYLANK